MYGLVHLSFHCFDLVVCHFFTLMQLDLSMNVTDGGSRLV